MRQKPPAILPQPLRRPSSPSCCRCASGRCRRCSGSGRAAVQRRVGSARRALAADETLEGSIRRQLATKVDVRELAHLEQLGTWSEPGRHPSHRELATAFLGLVPADVDPELPADTAWHVVDDLPARLRPRRDRARGAGAPARQALLHERRLRARARDVHALGAARSLRGGARPRRLGDEPEARAPPPRRARADRRPARAGRAAAGRRRSTASAAAASRSRIRSRRCGRPPSAAALRRLRRSATGAAPSRPPACACPRPAWPSPCARACARSPAR